MYIIKLVDDFNDVIDEIKADSESNMREAVRELALNIDVGEKIIVE